MAWSFQSCHHVLLCPSAVFTLGVEGGSWREQDQTFSGHPAIHQGWLTVPIRILSDGDPSQPGRSLGSEGPWCGPVGSQRAVRNWAWGGHLLRVPKRTLDKSQLMNHIVSRESVPPLWGEGWKEPIQFHFQATRGFGFAGILLPCLGMGWVRRELAGKSHAVRHVS